MRFKGRKRVEESEIEDEKRDFEGNSESEQESDDEMKDEEDYSAIIGELSAKIDSITAKIEDISSALEILATEGIYINDVDETDDEEKDKIIDDIENLEDLNFDL